MIGTIINGNLDIDHRITSYNTVFESCFYAGLDRVDEFLRNNAANDSIFEFEAFARFHRFKTQPAVTVLAVAAGLTDELTFGFNGFTDGFTVSNLRFAYGAVYVKFTSHTIDNDVEVEFAHAGDDGLVGFRIGVYFEGRIFFCQSLKSIAHLFLVSFGLWFNSNGNDRIREFHFFEDDRMIYIAEGIAGGDILEADCCSDIAGVSAVDFLTMICMHLKDTANAFFLSFGGVQNVGALVHDTGVYTEECQFTNEWVSHDLECERCHWCAVRCFAGDFLAVKGSTFDRRNIQRRWQVVKDSIEQHLDAFVLVCRTAEYREEFAVKNLLTERRFDLFHGEFFAFEVFFHQFVTAFSSSFDDLFAEFFNLVSEIGRYVFDMVLFAVIAVINFSLSGQQVNDTGEGILSADRELHWNSSCMEAGIHGFYRMEEISTDGIHLVDECDTRYMIVVCLSPNGFRLGLNAVFRTEYCYGAIEYAQRTFNFYSEVYVPWGIDDVYAVAFPVAGGSSGGNGNTTFLFLFHPVHGSSAIVNFTDLMVYTGIIQDTFRGCGLTCIDVRHDADVSCFFKRKFSAHDFFSLLKLPAVMSESLVCFSHFMGIFLLLYSSTSVVESVHQFTCKTFFHGTFAAQTGIVDHPADTQSQTTVCSYFYRYLVVCAADTTSTNFQNWHYVVQSLFENFDRFFVELAVADVKCAIYNGFCDTLLAVKHYFIDETSDCLVSIHGIRQHVTFRNSTFSRHC